MRPLPSGAAALACAAALAAPGAASAQLAAPEVHSPDGTARGTVIVIHGGSWWASGEPVMATTRPMARRFAGWGWRAVNADYGQRAAGGGDLERILDRELARAGRRPVCVYGESAGGHWALMLAARRRQVACAMAMAAPTDLVDTPPESDLEELTTTLFRPDERARLSPARLGDRIGARVLLGYGANDPIVPLSQGLRMRAALRSGTLQVLEPGPVAWMHGITTTRAALGGLLRGMRTTLSTAQRRAAARSAARRHGKPRRRGPERHVLEPE